VRPYARAELVPVLRRSKPTKIGEDATETLDVVARQWFVIRACAGEAQLPLLRDDHTAPGTVPCDRGAEPAGDDASREVRQPPAAQPAERALCT
jgi:hypothetical protein